MPPFVTAQESGARCNLHERKEFVCYKTAGELESSLDWRKVPPAAVPNADFAF